MWPSVLRHAALYFGDDGGFGPSCMNAPMTVATSSRGPTRNGTNGGRGNGRVSVRGAKGLGRDAHHGVRPLVSKLMVVTAGQAGASSALNGGAGSLPTTGFRFIPHPPSLQGSGLLGLHAISMGKRAHRLERFRLWGPWSPP